MVLCPAAKPPLLPIDPYRAAGFIHGSSHAVVALRRAAVPNFSCSL